MLILNPAIIEFIEAGIIILKKILTPDFESNIALLINSAGTVLAPRCVFTHKGKIVANEMENTFEKSPMPKKVINTGSNATGGKALKTLRTGVRILSKVWFLPVKSPSIIPIIDPIKRPVIPLHIEVEKSMNNSPLFAHSIIAK